MKRRDFLKLAPAGLLPLVGGCYWRIDPLHVLIRSPYITSMAQEREILSRAKLGWTEDKKVRVLYVSGTPYERGYQHGYLLRKEVKDNLGYLYKKGIQKYPFIEEPLAEVYERMRPYIPQEYLDEMHGLAHGSRMPLEIIHRLHIVPSLAEWSGVKRISKIVKKMIKGEDFEEDMGTSCSNFAVMRSATESNDMYVVRILDWGLHRISKLHEHPLITISVPEKGYASCNIGWSGFLGAVSGINEEAITLGEMGYGKPPNERLDGLPMIFLLRNILSYTSNLEQVREQIGTSRPTASFVFLMSDGKIGDAELYVRDPDRFLTFEPGVDLRDKKDFFPAIPDVLYGGHYEDIMTEYLSKFHGRLNPEMLMNEVIPPMVMKSNFQNVVYHPSELRFWVNNARSKRISAKTEPYSFFDFGKALKEYRTGNLGLSK